MLRVPKNELKPRSLDNNWTYGRENKKTMFIINDLNSPIKYYALSKVYIEDEHYIYVGMGTFFEERGAPKVLTLEQGLEWDGEDGIDDYAS